MSSKQRCRAYLTHSPHAAAAPAICCCQTCLASAARFLLLHFLTLFRNDNSAWTNKLITAKDHASVQLNIGHLNDEGSYTGAFTTFALAGRVRAQVCHAGG